MGWIVEVLAGLGAFLRELLPALRERRGVDYAGDQKTFDVLNDDIDAAIERLRVDSDVRSDDDSESTG